MEFYYHAFYAPDLSMPNMTGRPGAGQWKRMEEVPRRVPRSHPSRPLVLHFVFRGGNRGAFRLPGEGGDHFHCTVEPSPSHIRCRLWADFSFANAHKMEMALPTPPPPVVLLKPSSSRGRVGILGGSSQTWERKKTNKHKEIRRDTPTSGPQSSCRRVPFVFVIWST